MNTTSLLVILTGLFIRLTLPLGITALIAYRLHKLDEGWQAEAKRENEQLVKNEIPCLRQQGLSVDQMKLRAMFSGQPCWQIHRTYNGYLREDCLDCEVFRSAPLPPVHSHVHTFKM